MNNKLIAFLLLFYFVYLLVGAAVFWALEFSNEERLCTETIAQLQEYNINGDGTTSVVDSVSSMNGSLRELVQLLLKVQENGVQIDDNFQLSCAHNWDYQSSFFFAGTVITTIGYGHISPSTSGGRVFCIFFAAFGLPIFALMFAGIGGIFANLFKKLENRWRTKIQNEKRRQALMLLAVVTCLIVFGLLIPSAIFTAVEQWTYEEAFYYSFITLTTIGFGDFVVGNNPNLHYIIIYRVMVYFWILFGLAFMATVISMFSDIVKDKTTRLKNTKEEEEEEEVELPNNSDFQNPITADGKVVENSSPQKPYDNSAAAKSNFLTGTETMSNVSLQDEVIQNDGFAETKVDFK